MAPRADLIAIIEAAHRLDLDEQAWIGAIAEVAAPLLDDGNGLAAYLLDTTGHGPAAHTPVFVGADCTTVTALSRRPARTACGERGYARRWRPTVDDERRWREYKERVFGTEYMIWHDGLDTSAVASSTGAAREDTLTMLRLGVSLGDAHAAQALSVMGDAESTSAMRAQLARACGTSRVRLARAIHALSPDPALAAELVGVLRSPDHWSVRIDAAIGLRDFGGEGDERALLDAVAGDPEYLVRYHAAESLLARWRVRPASITKHRAIFQRLAGPQEGAPSPEDFARFAEARAMLEAARSRA